MNLGTRALDWWIAFLENLNVLHEKSSDSFYDCCLLCIRIDIMVVQIESIIFF